LAVASVAALPNHLGRVGQEQIKVVINNNLLWAAVGSHQGLPPLVWRAEVGKPEVIT